MRRVLVGLVILVLLVAGAGAAFTLISGDGSDDGDEGSPRRTSRRLRRRPEPCRRATRSWPTTTTSSSTGSPATRVTTTSARPWRSPSTTPTPRARRIKLALLKVVAREPDAKVGSLVVNPGGPGSPGTSYAAAGDSYWGDALLDHFDIVGFDPRGTGDSTAVDCLTDEQLDDYLASEPVPDSPAELAEFESRARTFGEGLRHELRRSRRPRVHGRGGPRHGHPPGRAR